MKKTISLKKFSTLSSDADIAPESSAPAKAGSTPQEISDPNPRFAAQQGKPEEEFRENLRRRETAPFVSAIPYHHWVLNE